MAGEGGSGGGSSCGGSECSSPRNNRVKFLCSHGGKILPRPADGYLKYVGGETRVISLSRSITFLELMQRLTAMFDGDMVLKYQLMTEDLDALVSVRSDEDLKHMLDEYDRQENEGSSRLRTFLFPSKLVMIENQMPILEHHHMLEQRYIDAINGIIRLTPKFHPQQQLQQQILPPTMTVASSPMSSFSISSACSSPQSASPEHHLLSVDMSMGSHRFTLPPSMHKVQSSPSLCGPQQTYQGHVHGRPHYPNYHQNHHLPHQSSFSARAHHRGIRTPPPLSSPSRSESWSLRSSMMGVTGTSSHGQNHYNNSKPPSGNNSPRSSLGRQSGGGGGGGGGGGYCGKCGYYDTCPPYACNRNMDRADHSLPQSPR